MIKRVIVRNVNMALEALQLESMGESEWRNISPRGAETLEYRGMWVTEYMRPTERVLFSPDRDANPFFHFMESLWILDGRDDVGTLAKYNSRMVDYSDNGLTFNGAYGYRLRHAYRIDQIERVIKLLTADPDTRRAVVAMWHPLFDLGVKSKDIPCNDFIFFKLRDGRLNITVGCRSNDAIWGAYGANAVQFSVIQEFVARALGVEVGTYIQVSDSFHVYTEQESWKKVRDGMIYPDKYESMNLRPYPLMGADTGWVNWLEQLHEFMDGSWNGESPRDPFFDDVALVIENAWHMHKSGDSEGAIKYLAAECRAEDWKIACIEWLYRRIAKRAQT